MKTKEAQEHIIDIMRRWQKVENASVSSTSRVIEETDNPVIRIIMEIIQQDSMRHYRIQELIADTLEGRPVELNFEQMADVWDKIEQHIELEQKTIDMAKSALEAIQGKKMLVQEYLIKYLLKDEEKHNAVLDDLRKIKAGMYPYA